MPANNYLEELAAEWYQFLGYFVQRNVRVGPRTNGGHECELDIIAFQPESQHILHVEATMDGDSWEIREKRYGKKFDAGKKYIPSLFRGCSLPDRIEQRMLIGYGRNSKQRKLSGGQDVVTVGEFLREICHELKDRRVAKAAVPESFPLVRGIQFMIENRHVCFDF